MEDRTVLFRNALVVDGTGSAPFCADVLVKGNKIEDVSAPGLSAACDESIDAAGLIFCPGFMDIHAHSDLEVLRNPAMENKIQQGITFDLSGNCGAGVFPRKIDSPAAFADILGHYDNWNWTDFSSYSKQLKPGINIAFLQAHGSLRNRAIEGNPNREATNSEIERMCSLLDSSIADGCFGFSTGLYYAPCMFASRKELLALLSVVRRRNAVFAVHHRCEGDDILPSIDEVISLVRETGVKFEVSHLKAIGRKNQDKVPQVLEKLHALKDDGFDVAFDQYPYEYGSTSLFSLLPPDLLRLSSEDLSEVLVRTRTDKTLREDIFREMEHPHNWDSITELCPWEDISVVLLESSPQYNGLNLMQVAEKLSEDPYQALFDLLSKERGVALMADITQSPQSLRTIFEDDMMLFGTDALYTGKTAHPRSANGAIHLLFERCVKENYPFEKVIAKMTGNVARRLGIRDRGLVKKGCKADLVLFNPSALRDNSSLEKPFEMCSGLEAVMVNGVFAFREGKLTHSQSGSPVRF